MNNKKILTLLSLILSCSWQSCDLIDPAEDPATILDIQPFAYYDSLAGKNSYAQVHSAFVYFNNAPLGVYELPAKVPISGNATGDVLILPGVTRNGTSAYQSIYLPYYGYNIRNLSPQPRQTIKVEPVTGYRSALKQSNFVFEENFETSSQFLSVNSDSAFTRKKVNNCTYCDQGTGVFTLSNQQRSSEIISSTFFTKENQSTYLELNYRNDTEFSVGLALLNGSGVTDYYMVTFRARADWNKVYIPLNETMNLVDNVQRVYLLFKTSLPAGQENGIVELDNIRVLSF